MRALVTNDDGIESMGLRTLAAGSYEVASALFTTVTREQPWVSDPT